MCVFSEGLEFGLEQVSRKVFGALGQLSFSLGMFQLVFGSTTVIYVSLSGVFTPKKEATYFQFSSGRF